ncbi:MAG: diguanylate cyclase domain-containing protein [Betaproteobacteria bacterium]
MNADLWSALNALALACCVVIAVSYLLSQLAFVRRWLMGDRSPLTSLLISLSMSLISTAGELLTPPFSLISRNVRYIAPVVGGMYGGPAVGVGQGVFFLVWRLALERSWPGGGVVVPLLVGLVAGVLSRGLSYRLTLWKAAIIAIVALTTDAVLSPWLEGAELVGWLPELGTHIADFLTVMIVTRIFENERAEEEHKRILADLALTDGLTHLANHRQFHTQLAKEIESARVRGSQVALVMLDIDYFKNYNDAFGHPEGDRLLTAIGDAIRAVIRSGDTGARYGGDEFALILPNTDLEAAQAVARRVQEAVNRYVHHDAQGRKTGVSLSAGVAVYPNSATDKDALIKRADEALYAAKYSEARVEVYHSVFDDLKAQLDSSELSLINTVKTLLTVINAKDRYTYGHSERVVNYCLIIARQLSLEEEQVKLLRIAAFLHDIGKIEIARDILNKETKLTPEERKIIEQHPVWGAEIIKPVRSLRDVVPIVLHHHERYDGTGYPDRLRCAEIPWLARILSVADAFDAMTTERPYQRAKAVSEALAELRRCAGTQFDPWVVDAFAASFLEAPARTAAGAE